MINIRLLFSFVCFHLLCLCISAGFYQERINEKCSKLNGDLENGSYKEKNDTIHGKVREYMCDKHHVSNVPGLHKMRFKCVFHADFGDYTWRATQSKFLTYKPIYLQQITCQLKKECPKPPLPQHMVRERTVQYEEAVSHSGVEEPRDKYYSGDTMVCSCQEGYSVKSKIEQLLDYSYTYDDETEEPEPEVTISRNITCDDSGRWNGQEWYELRFETCEAIVCDASRFSEMYNGNITNYKPVYGYGQGMRLVCNEGYKPIDGNNVAMCTTRTSFDEFILPSFGCEPIQCIEPASPKNGRVRLQGHKAYFYCESGYKLIGSSDWTCLPNGKWDATCARCENQDSSSYCQAPCIPIGADVTTFDDTFTIGSVLEFTCTSGRYFGGSTNRTCMENRKWSGTPIDCTGESVFDVNIGVQILNTLAIQVPYNETIIQDELTAKFGNLDQKGGVDVYFLVDISKSITNETFNATNRFISAILPQISIHADDTGTRVALYYFATKSYVAFNNHYAHKIFEKYEDVQEEILKQGNITEIQNKHTEYGTAISSALKDIKIDIETKLLMQTNGRLRTAQQVIIILSDGRFNTGGSPEPVAEELKNIKQIDLEIYSIFVGNSLENKIGLITMEKMASKIEGETHFFAIDSNSDFDYVINQMIKKVENITCGMTKAHRTNMKNEKTHMKEHNANLHAWPWMAQLVNNNGDPLCGGSLINEQWVLTAAHCFNSVEQVHLKKLKRKEFTGIISVPVDKADTFTHPKYDEKVQPMFKYDIGLIRLQKTLTLEKNLLPVCLWNNETKDSTNTNYSEFFKGGDKIFGIVTGWGRNHEILQQMQMSIKSSDECTKNQNETNRKNFDEDLMFCAGGNDNIIVDACKGDSGGPFIVEHPTIENKYIQIGIVSFGFGECQKTDTYGVYTKLNDELLNWIADTIKTNTKNV